MPTCEKIAFLATQGIQSNKQANQQRKSNADSFHSFLNIKNRPMPKATKLSPFFAVGHFGVIMEKKLFAAQNVWKESAGNVAGTETSLHWKTQPKGNWPLTI